MGTMDHGKPWRWLCCYSRSCDTCTTSPALGNGYNTTAEARIRANTCFMPQPSGLAGRLQLFQFFRDVCEWYGAVRDSSLHIGGPKRSPVVTFRACVGACTLFECGASPAVISESWGSPGGTLLPLTTQHASGRSNGLKAGTPPKQRGRELRSGGPASPGNDPEICAAHRSACGGGDSISFGLLTADHRPLVDFCTVLEKSPPLGCCDARNWSRTFGARVSVLRS